jgi:hypothetical protein
MPDNLPANLPAFSDHSFLRATQRNLSVEEIDYVVCYGQLFHRAGVEFYFLCRKDLPSTDQGNARYQRLVGTAVVLSRDGRTIITTWRNPRNGLKRIKCKPEYGWYTDD